MESIECYGTAERIPTTNGITSFETTTSADESNRHRKNQLTVEVLAMVVGLVLFMVFLPICSVRVLDDAYITYRFAEHLSEGYGFAWNIDGEPTEGFTSLLHVLLCAAAHKVGWDLLLFTRVLSIGSLVLCMALCRFWMKRAFPTRSWLRASVWVLFLGNGCLVFSSLFGMETLISTLVLSSTAFLWWQWSERLSFGTSGILATLAVLCAMARPDFVLWIVVACGIVLAFEVRKWLTGMINSKSMVTSITMAAVVLLPMMAYIFLKYLYFGMRLPNPYYVKSASGWFAVSLEGSTYVAMFLIWNSPLIIGMCVGIIYARGLRWVSVFGATIMYILVFIRFHPLMGTSFRFLQPAFPIIVVLGLIGWDRVIVKHRWLVRRAGFGRAKCLHLSFVLGFLAWLFLWSLSSYAYVMSRTKNENTRNYVRVGSALAEIRGKPGSIPTVATGDQGALPFYSRWNSLDFVGLTTNSIATMTSAEDIVRYVLEEMPELILVRRFSHGTQRGQLFIGDGISGRGDVLAAHSSFAQCYIEVGSIPDESNNRIVFFVNKGKIRAPEVAHAVKKGIADIRGAVVLPIEFPAITQ